jgi:hypothetical protein
VPKKKFLTSKNVLLPDWQKRFQIFQYSPEYDLMAFRIWVDAVILIQTGNPSYFFEQKGYHLQLVLPG